MDVFVFDISSNTTPARPTSTLAPTGPHVHARTSNATMSDYGGDDGGFGDDGYEYVQTPLAQRNTGALGFSEATEAELT